MTFRSILFRAWYWYVNVIDKKKEILFMNYGYHDSNEIIELDEHDEPNRFSIQLYHRLAKMVDVKAKDIIEVGCGRGGGLAYITKHFFPKSALGIDLDIRAANFGNKHYHLDGLSFKQGNAQNLELKDASIDIVFNVESSHRYPNMDMFLNEVYRVLKPGGYFLLTDFRYAKDLDALLELLKQYKFIKFDEQWINNNVVEALELDNARREALVNKYAPPFFKKATHSFAGAIGSHTYNEIKNGGYVYFVFCFQKPM
jgi:ubiquinone/menaquinone biosynthesis C-methylase UbiE